MNAWLWPDRIIYKRESRRLRDEHNAVVDQAQRVETALRRLLTATEGGTRLEVLNARGNALDVLKGWPR